VEKKPAAKAAKTAAQPKKAVAAKQVKQVKQPSKTAAFAGADEGHAVLPAAVQATAASTHTARPAQNASDNHNEAILAMHEQGLGELEIAKKLKLGVGEIRVVLGLYRGGFA
jgi:DNA-binding NarL/FixJ family response regulator